MAWTAPMTVVATQVFTASAFNSQIRDNLLETAAGKATLEGGMFVANDTNALEERFVESATIATPQTTSSTSYTDLVTVGPTVTVDTGTSAIAIIQCTLSTGTNAIGCNASVEAVGTTTISASHAWAIRNDGVLANYSMRGMSAHHFTGLTAGSNTFTMKYMCDSAAATATFLDRHLVVIPI